METTLDYAESHFPQLMRQVKAGEEILLRDGVTAVAKIIPVPSHRATFRPQVGVLTSAPVQWNATSFTALDESGLKALGLL